MEETLIRDIKFNCDVSDAKHWGFFSLCGMLMRLRDLFRSEMNLPPWSPIPQDAIGEWITQKESRWAELESGDFRDLIISGSTYHPFEVSEINLALKGEGLVYGAGYGVYMKPNFMLAELSSRREIYDYRVYLAGREYARDLFASPGMLQGRCIFLRLEPLKTLLWEKLSGFRAAGKAHLGYTLSCYGFNPERQDAGGLAEKFEEIARAYSNVVLYHELAEDREDTPDWPDMLVGVRDKDTEFLLRALKDLISDTSEFGPLKVLIDGKDRGALGLYVALIEGYRRKLYPEIKAAFDAFMDSEDWHLIEGARTTGYERFSALRDSVLGLYRSGTGREALLAGIKALLSPRQSGSAE